MPAMSVTIESIAQGGRPFTRADLERTPDDGRRYELIDGLLIVSATPGLLHQRAVTRLLRALDDACPPGLEVLPGPFGVGLADDTEIQPDVLVGRGMDFTERDLSAAPVLAVEVLSPASRLIDLYVKRDRFERAGTTAYWVVDPAARPGAARLIAWELRGRDGFHQVGDVVGDEPFPAVVPFPVTVTPADLVR